MSQFGPGYMFKSFLKEQKEKGDLLYKKNDTEDFSRRFGNGERNNNETDEIVDLKGNRAAPEEKNEVSVIPGTKLNPGDVVQLALGDETYLITKNSVMDSKLNEVQVEAFKYRYEQSVINDGDIDGDNNFSAADVRRIATLVDYSDQRRDVNGGGACDYEDIKLLQSESDVDGDGIVDERDRRLREEYRNSREELWRADMNGDGIVSRTDIDLAESMYKYWTNTGHQEKGAFLSSFFGDNNYDGVINSKDISLYNRYSGMYVTDKTLLDSLSRPETIVSRPIAGHELESRLPKEGYILGKIANNAERTDRGMADKPSADALSPETQVVFLAI
ncbi:MAG: hypothetical protein HQL30_12380, partial [Candidatus Omnitrophica bacterium]|nr:hypothetical protein [Candidatus Omnitrophota bacterium]